MGNCKSACSASTLPWSPTREITVLLLGLDNAGKSTLLANLNGESTDNITPTIGFASSNLDIGRFEVTVYDLGGGPRIRGIWKNYYPEAHGIIFVVDASASDRVDEAKDVLNSVIQHEKVGGKPLLVFANKQDQDGAIDESELGSQLQLDTLMGDNRLYTNVVKCIAYKSASGNKSDSSIKQGLKCLLNVIGGQYDSISDRVRADVIEQKAFEAQQRKERAERVRRIREERERQQALSDEKEEDDENDADGGEMLNPFRPIAEVAKEAEEREKAAKAAKKAKKNEQQLSVELQPQVSTIAESTRNELSEVSASDYPGARIADNVAAKVQKSSSQSTLASQTTSGLSESSESLTDVTPRSHGSSDSLRLSSQNNAHASVAEERDEGKCDSATESTQSAKVQAEEVEKGKKRSRKKLLSRLKNRNKTAPAQGQLEQSTDVQPIPGHAILSKRDTWTGPELEAAVITPPQTPPNPPVTTTLPDNVDHDPFAGLPELPRNRHVLPPLKVLKTPAGVGDNTFHLPEDISTLPPNSIIPLSLPPPQLTASKLETVAA